MCTMLPPPLASSWMPDAAALKRYPHFDAPLGRVEAGRIATDPAAVANNAFYPLLRYIKKFQPFRGRAVKPAIKEREIRYAARRDAYIMAYYRSILSELYEKKLISLGISDCPIAYRKIPEKGGAGKCNIHFAHDAFSEIERIGDCVAVALDISKFFEHIDHEKLKVIWCDLLGVSKLPADHFAVFKTVTNYAFVDRDEAFLRLGIIKEENVHGKLVRRYTVRPSEVRTQLCSPEQFRRDIAGGDASKPSIIKRNLDAYGIPQGTPISDILANMSLINFDVVMSNYARERGGVYFRYSDDILLIIPGGAAEGIAAEKFAQRVVADAGPKLVIKPSKTSIVEFTKVGGSMAYNVPGTYAKKNGLEYLGFRFDGVNIYIRDSTLANLRRKMAKVVYNAAITHVRRYRTKKLAELRGSFDLDAVMSRFGRVQEFEKFVDEKRRWTFWTYAKKATTVFGRKGAKIPMQLKRNRAHLEKLLDEKLPLAYARVHR